VEFRALEQGRERLFAYRHALAIVTDVVLDNVGMREVEERHGVRHGHGRKVVRGSLDRYCLVAGWLEKRGRG
jgi:hypothetical protein